MHMEYLRLNISNLKLTSVLILHSLQMVAGQFDNAASPHSLIELNGQKGDVTTS